LLIIETNLNIGAVKDILDFVLKEIISIFISKTIRPNKAQYLISANWLMVDTVKPIMTI